MSRLSNEEIKKIKNKYNVDRLWSYSRINTFINSPFEYALKYVDGIKAKEDRQDSIYVSTGTISHDIIEKFYMNEIEYTDMYDLFEDGWFTCYELSNLKFDRTNEEKNKSVAERYKSNMEYFFKNHTVYPYKMIIEMPITINVNNNIFVGYIDGLFKNDNGDITIVDFKSSSAYKGNELENHSQQLKLYALGIHQLTGIPLSKIHGCFNFMKYVTIEYTQANNVTKTRDVERNNLGEALQSNLKVWIKKLGYEDRMDEFLKMVLDSNDIKGLPEEIRNKYKLYDCHVYVDISEKAIQKLVDEVSATIKDIEYREQDYKEMHNEKIWWDSDESVESNSYYFANLCSFSPNLHKPYQSYLEKLEREKNGIDLFNNISSNNVISDNKSINKNEPDLSWLSSI